MTPRVALPDRVRRLAGTAAARAGEHAGEERFTSRWHDERVAARVGLWLGVAFTVCMLTGVLSHLIQHPPSWFAWPSRPVQLYRVTQGVHVLTGLATVPLVLVKLWTVYPRLFARPPVRSLLHAAERASVFALVASALFQLVSGVQNIAHWYTWGFSFPPAHHAVAWVLTGAVVLHVAVQLPAIRRGLGSPLEPSSGDGLSRRWLLAGAAGGAAAVVLATAGQTVPWLRRVSVLAVRSGQGPQGVPVNKTAASAGVTDAARDPAWRLTVRGPRGERAFALAELRAMPQRTAELPISCVEGWSASARWTGVPVRDLVAAVGGGPDADVRFVSLQQGGYGVSVLPAPHARDGLSLLALAVNGEPLALDHGYPCRLIAPNRPGVLQTKWLAEIEVLT